MRAPLLLFLSLAVVDCGAPVDRAGEAAAIRGLVERMSTTACAGDWMAYQTMWAHDSTVEFLDAQEARWITGWGELSLMYKALIPQLKGCRMTLTRFRPHVSNDGTMAWAASEALLYLSDSTPAPVKLWGAFAFEKRDGAWKPVLDHSGVVRDRDSAGTASVWALSNKNFEQTRPPGIKVRVAPSVRPRSSSSGR